MERFWKKVSPSELQECFDILNTYSLIEKETYKKFTVALFEVAKRQLGCEDVTLHFVDDMQNNLGVSSSLTNTVTLNLAKMEKQTLFKTVSTIYHELTHLHQERTGFKKEIGTCMPNKFPFERCIGNEKFLPTEILGISTSLFYFTCKHEKEARDAGNECGMEVFTALKEIAERSETKGGTARFIDRCILQTQNRIIKEKADYSFAYTQGRAFIASHPNFMQTAFDKIKKEYLDGARMCAANSKEKYQCENRFNYRIGALVLMGCDDYMKAQILSFVSNNFVNRGEIFTSLVSVIDSPYSRVNESDLSTLFKFAGAVNCSKESLANYLTSWDKNYITGVMNNSSSLNNGRNNTAPTGGGIEL